MLQGEYDHTLDAKGRIVVPSKVREELGDHFVISKGFEHCLYIFPKESWDKFVGKMEALPGSSAKVRKVQRHFIGGSKECEPDKQGRFSIPANLREYASITKDVVLVGLADRLEVWDQSMWKEYCDEDESIEEVAEELLF
ncbi:MAG: division/cell wall cluster transcriptional repressor MraZ [Lachnospiraceae bacterium]|nr:division/cell wall cluster transcriptional repressor MraZ [Lachnospiraceae bacterium]